MIFFLPCPSKSDPLVVLWFLLKIYLEVQQVSHRCAIALKTKDNMLAAITWKIE